MLTLARVSANLDPSLFIGNCGGSLLFIIMTTKTTESIVFSTDGSVQKHTLVVADLVIDDEFISRLSVGADRKIPQAFSIGKHYISLIMSSNNVYATMPIAWIALKAPFQMVDGVLVPNLSSDTSPVLDLVWNIPTGMRCYLLFHTTFDAANGLYFLTKTWLFSQSHNKELWRLPLGNLYDDSSICTGRERFDGPSIPHAIKQCLLQFNRSLWNADLWRDVDHCQKMFRFKPHSSGFEQLPYLNSDWTSLCRKISVAISSKLCL